MKKYNEQDIQVLSDVQHVRKRTNVYLGNVNKTSYEVPLFLNDTFNIKSLSFVPAVYRAVNECVDNVIDEYTQHPPKNPILTINANTIMGMYEIKDVGRGVPIGKHKTGKFTPEVVFGALRSGRNFEDGRDIGVIGMNGMGVSLTNFCSTEFKIDIHRDGKRYRQTFSNGAESISRPSIRSVTSKKTGTSVNFQLDGEVFEDITLPEELMENRAIELALTNPGVVTEYNGKKYKYKKGFDELIKKLSSHYYKFTTDTMEFFVIFDVHTGIDERIFSWVNSSLLFDGGLCNTQFLNAFYDRTTTHLKKEAKKQKCEVTKNDVRQNLLVIGNLKISDPQYDSQAKTRLTGPNLRKEMIDMIDANWASFARKNKDWLQVILERAMVRHHASANKKAIKEHQKTLRKKVPGLVDATSKTRYDCQVLITEGLSAASMITEARDPVTTASFPLTGKINNVYGSTPAQILNMGKLTNLLAAIGLVPGQKAMRGDLRFGKIIIATDADVDGGDIFTLLVNLFYTFWPELFNSNYEPIVYRLVAPNVCLTKGKQRIHFASRSEYEKHKSKYNGWTVSYYKGLGSMVREDWEMILSGKTDTLISITDDGKMEETLKLLFGPDANARKKWLQDE